MPPAAPLWFTVTIAALLIAGSPLGYLRDLKRGSRVSEKDLSVARLCVVFLFALVVPFIAWIVFALSAKSGLVGVAFGSSSYLYDLILVVFLCAGVGGVLGTVAGDRLVKRMKRFGESRNPDDMFGGRLLYRWVSMGYARYMLVCVAIALGGGLPVIWFGWNSLGGVLLISTAYFVFVTFYYLRACLLFGLRRMFWRPS